MVYRLVISILLGCFACLNCYSQDTQLLTTNKIVIEAQITADDFKKSPGDPHTDSIELQATPLDYIDVLPDWKTYKEQVRNNRIKWILYSEKPLLLSSDLFGMDSRVVNPGDSILINYKGIKERTHSGRGAEIFELQEAIAEIQRYRFTPPTKVYVLIYSIRDYLNWKSYFDNQLELIFPLISRYKDKVPAFALEVIKNRTIKSVEGQRIESFISLCGLMDKDSTVSPEILENIFDSTMNGYSTKWFLNCTDYPSDVFSYYQYNRIQVLKKLGFSINHADINSTARRKITYYNSLKANFKGLRRERLLQYILTEEVIKQFGYQHSVTQALLKDYYTQPGFPEYKRWMREFEKKASLSYTYSDPSDNPAPDFQLIDLSGNVFSKENLNGKIALLYFWYTGCSGSSQMTQALNKAETALKNDPNIAFVSISTDKSKNQWAKNLAQKKSTAGNSIHLYTGGQGINHPMISDYYVSRFPTLYLITAQGQIQYSVPDPKEDEGKNLIALLLKLRAESEDGPYVFHKDDSIEVNYIKNVNGSPQVFTEHFIGNKTLSFEVSTDSYSERFKVNLKSKLENEPAKFEQPEKQLVLSDIEGNFDALRKLLQTNYVIDKDYNWIFGNGHVIFVGDIFDRGNQVTECLWLIYSLEEKAKLAGGYVHYILGNHEILNLSNDQRYVTEKYKNNEVLLNMAYKEFYGKKSELGRWLRTKNIIEVIGDNLYTHAGISKEVNDLSISLQEMNDLIKPHYANRDEFKSNKNEPVLRILFNSTISPFWYRGYYKAGRTAATINQIDSTLRKFKVNHIITGHTIIADTVSIQYGGKIINVDTKHAEGKSEALLIEYNRYFRVNSKGEKELLIPERVKIGSRNISETGSNE